VSICGSLLRFLAIGIMLPIAACGTGADGAPSDEPEVGETGVAAAPLQAEPPLIPLPRPEGERAVGARIWEYQIEVTEDTVPAGDIEFHVVNAGTTEHWFIVRTDELFEGTPHLLPGDSAVLRVNLEPGEYTLVCTIRDEFDHISEGERESFVVR
jgi:hypothetical protein